MNSHCGLVLGRCNTGIASSNPVQFMDGRTYVQKHTLHEGISAVLSFACSLHASISS
jgi:hypothetical protein